MTAHKMLVEGISCERDKTLDTEAIKVRVLSLLKVWYIRLATVAVLNGT